MGYGWDNTYLVWGTTVIRMARKNIKVPEELFLALRDDKDDEQSWPHYLEEQCLYEDDIPSGLLEVQEATEEELADIKESLETVESRTGKLERMLEKVRRR